MKLNENLTFDDVLMGNKNIRPLRLKNPPVLITHGSLVLTPKRFQPAQKWHQSSLNLFAQSSSFIGKSEAAPQKTSTVNSFSLRDSAGHDTKTVSNTVPYPSVLSPIGYRMLQCMRRFSCRAYRKISLTLYCENLLSIGQTVTTCIHRGTRRSCSM